MTDMMFFLGLGAGSVLGAALAIWVSERKISNHLEEWENLLSDQQGHIAELRAINEAPVAVTRLTNRKRTVTI
jgi:hypothetical protein